MTFNNENYQALLKETSKNGQNTEIIAISKYHPKESVIQAINQGVRQFGENRIQEAKEKYLEIKKVFPEIRLHFTGNLQSNKIKHAIHFFDVFHTIYKESQLIEFVKYPDTLKEKDFFIQVNTGLEKTKGGVFPDQVEHFLKMSVKTYNMNIIGLMCIPPINEDPKKHFTILKNLKQKLNLAKLSMGMSNDFKEAISCGSNYIRVGTFLFGERS